MLDNLKYLDLRTYDLSVVESLHSSDITLNAILDKFIFHVPSGNNKDYIFNDICKPMAYFLDMFDLNLNNVKSVHFYLVNGYQQSRVFNASEDGFEARLCPHEYVIAVKRNNRQVISIMHELMHIIDEELAHHNLILHKKIFPYALRYFEQKAFTLSQIAFCYMKLPQITSKDHKSAILTLLDEQKAELSNNLDDLCQNYDWILELDYDEPYYYAVDNTIKLMGKIDLYYNDLESLLS